MILAYFASCTTPQQWWGLQILNLFYPILFFLHILIILFWLFSRPKFAWISIITLLVGWKQIPNYFNLSFNQKNPDKRITLMSFNVRKFISWSNGKYKRNTVYIDKIFDIAQDLDVDVLHLQEVDLSAKEKLFRQKNYPYSCFIEGGALAILSKYPLGQCEEIDFGNSVNGILSTPLYLQTDTFFLINVHLQSNKLKTKEVQQVEKRKINEKRFWKSLSNALQKYRIGAFKREKEIKILKKKVIESPYPVLLSGDFNEVPGSYAISQMTDILNDSFVEAGNGFGASFKELFETLRIDYIFVDPLYKFSSHKIVKTKFSDHQAIVATVIIK